MTSKESFNRNSTCSEVSRRCTVGVERTEDLSSKDPGSKPPWISCISFSVFDPSEFQGPAHYWHSTFVTTSLQIISGSKYAIARKTQCLWKWTISIYLFYRWVEWGPEKLSPSCIPFGSHTAQQSPGATTYKPWYFLDWICKAWALFLWGFDGSLESVWYFWFPLPPRICLPVFREPAPYGKCLLLNSAKHG